ncbi:hypothetical protein BT96DRAFT_991882 [Gymnopus androsaceus JB14]|uniref:HTH CENPB-type domain-containing protein n=1 Tax=Gymnopus androsaceus JB14 TaxID=1447944 RepID=A0A6A4HVG4_9AGAR|nr:hypothetical protein BT96DRAFT_991882 [Gymnopus androsaceus JB14]
MSAPTSANASSALAVPRIQPLPFSPGTTSSARSGSSSHPKSQKPLHSNKQRHLSKRQRLYDIDKKAICEYQLTHPDKDHYDIAQIFSVDRSTVSKVLKDKVQWLNVRSDMQGHGCFRQNRMLSKKRPLKFPNIDSRMVDWLQEVMGEFYSGLPKASIPNFSTPIPNNSAPFLARGPLSDAKIRAKATEIARDLRISEEKFKASDTWVAGFKNRQGIRQGIWSGYLPNNSTRNEVSLTSAAVPVKHLTHQTSSMQNSSLQPFPFPDPGAQNISSTHQFKPPLSAAKIPTHAECVDYLARISHCVDEGPGQGILSGRKREWLRKLQVQFVAAGSSEAPIVLDPDEEAL